jgi:hypothetical protein
LVFCRLLNPGPSSPAFATALPAARNGSVKCATSAAEFLDVAGTREPDG